ncbi:DEAD/DEAH box helicase [Planktothrix sp. FACHB-1355]|uniref:DEAD/DEAH box helicase n=1 Tax=Aerosakkonema funiforme FACHB-1375 TaxID=2949571 RepID=A0A926ZIK3_9CYAN|nr:MULTISPECIES: DEAD/DEAH box helicase [Oscillatoriales]MBD2181881.1 DEAD/DEAH box helicase [Aerosakkonema funiforme FACHB-1375]MBD3557301.1 DEAD/DEAH box helicase [Planktothrix sp. FACHB-1355]
MNDSPPDLEVQFSSSTYSLRDYQLQLMQQVFQEWSQGSRRILLTLPTGAGKTVLFAAVAREFTNFGSGVLVLAHREELILQAAQKMEGMTGEPVGIIKAGYPTTPERPIQVASVQTLVRRSPQFWPTAELLIVDEAHHSVSKSYQQIAQHYQHAYILGVTATPARIDGQGFKFLYDTLVVGPSVAALIQIGYLSTFKLFAAPNAIKVSGVRTTGGDYNQRELAAAIDTSLVMGDLIDAWNKFAFGKKTVVFAVDIKHSIAIAQAYQEAGIPTEHLDGNTSEQERHQILERFQTGQTLILCNCGIVSEGVDIPSLEAVQCVRPTKSLILWLQMVGRSLRPHPDKEHAIIIDHTENWGVHGAPDFEWLWSLEPISLSRGRWHVSCPECHHVFKPLSHEQKPYRIEWSPRHGEFQIWCLYTCPNCLQKIEMEKWSGGEPPPPRRVTEDKKAEIREIPLDCNWVILADICSLATIQRRRNYKSDWVLRRLVEKHPSTGIPELRECANILEFSLDWVVDCWFQLLKKNTNSSVTPTYKESPLDNALDAPVERVILQASQVAELFRKASRWSEAESIAKTYSALKVAAWELLSPAERARIKSLKVAALRQTATQEKAKIAFDTFLGVGEKAVSTATGEEVLVTGLFEKNGIPMANIKYLSDGIEGTSRLDFLRTHSSTN